MIKRRARRLLKLFSFIYAASLCALMPVKAYAKNNDDIDNTGPEIKVVITDDEKVFTNKERKAYVSVSVESFENDVVREYIFKEGEDALFLSVKDEAGNTSIYQSDIYIQDYTPPKAVVCGIKDAENINQKIQIEIGFEEEWPDINNSFVTLAGQNSGKVKYFYFTENEKCLKINDELEDDYYTLYWLENFTKRLIIKSRNIKFVFSYLVMYCVPPQYKYEARQKFINKVKMEEK